MAKKRKRASADTMKPPAQLDLFAGVAKCSQDTKWIHSLGLLGWNDPLWTQTFAVQLQDGSQFQTTLGTIRALRRANFTETASSAENRQKR